MYAKDGHTHTRACTSVTCYTRYAELASEPGCRLRTPQRWASSNAYQDAYFALNGRNEYAVFPSMAEFDAQPRYSRFARRNADRVHTAKSGQVVVKINYM
jgi:hypothetical protein